MTPAATRSFPVNNAVGLSFNLSSFSKILNPSLIVIASPNSQFY